MTELASKLLHKLGFVRINSVDKYPVAVDLSTSVQLGSSGQAGVPIEKVMRTDSFQRDLEILEEIANAHRQDQMGR